MSPARHGEAGRGLSRRGLFSLGAARLIPDEEGLGAIGLAMRSFQEAEAGVERRERADFAALADRARLAWGQGDAGAAFAPLTGAAQALVAAAGVTPGQTVLDVGAGDGNVALAAAAAGAEVTGVDLSPALVARGRERSTRAGADVHWEVADVDALGFADGSFDCVLSGFGAIFSPQPRVAAAELARVARPGGVVALTAWSSSGFMGRVLELASTLAPPPAEASRPSRWGRYESAFLWLGSVVEEFEMTGGTVDLEFGGAEAAWTGMSFAPGPLRAALESAGDDGREQTRAAFGELVERFGLERESGGLSIPASYSLLSGRKPVVH